MRRKSRRLKRWLHSAALMVSLNYDGDGGISLLVSIVVFSWIYLPVRIETVGAKIAS